MSSIVDKPSLITPYGGRLVNLLVPAEERERFRAYAGSLPSIIVSARTECDLELLAVGAFSPLDSFMGQKDHQRVIQKPDRQAQGHSQRLVEREDQELFVKSQDYQHDQSAKDTG